MLLYYIVGGSALLSLTVGYLWGNKTGHQQEQHSREATAVRLDAEIAQKKQWIEKLTESYETYKKLEQGAEKNLNLETQRLLKIRDQQLLARQKDYSQKIASLDETISRKQQEIERLNTMAADARNNLDVHRQQALASYMADLDCQKRFLAEREKQLKENQAMLDSILHAEHSLLCQTICRLPLFD